MAMSFRMSEMDSETKALRNKDRIILNVGGVRHETFKSTLRNFPDTRLAWITGRDDFPDYDPEKNEYFFDRHPGVFQQIMNFYRTGKLHCPSDVCGPLFEEELNFWGIDEKQMESCCWSTYTLHREAQENLKVFNGPDFEDDTGSAEDADEWENRESFDEHRASNTPSWQRWRSKIWSVFDDHTSSNLAKIYVWVSLAFVVVSVLSLCASTDKNVEDSNVGILVTRVVDYVCGVWFTAEFILRCATCPDILHFSRQLLNWIDFIAIIPFYLKIFHVPKIVTDTLVLVRMLRLFRFFKLSLGLQILKHTVVASSKEMVLLFLLVMIPVLIFAGILHLCEKNVTSTKFKSIPETFWWAIITLTTVGYGDMAPLTTQGKIFGSICAAVSMFISALPISIIGANFSLYYRHAQAKLKLPKKPRKVLIGAANTLIRDDPETEGNGNDDDQETSERHSSDDLTTEVYLGPKRPRRQRMSLFANGIVPQRSSRIRSLGGDHLMSEHTNNNIEKNKGKQDTSDNHKSSLLSTSTKSTTVDSPPPRCVSFPTNLQSIDKCTLFEHENIGAADNPAFVHDNRHCSPPCNGRPPRSRSAGSHPEMKRNGAIVHANAPRVTITVDCDKENRLITEEPTEQNNESEGKTDARLEAKQRPNSPEHSKTYPLAQVDG